MVKDIPDDDDKLTHLHRSLSVQEVVSSLGVEVEDVKGEGQDSTLISVDIQNMRSAMLRELLSMTSSPTATATPSSDRNSSPYQSLVHSTHLQEHTHVEERDHLEVKSIVREECDICYEPMHEYTTTPCCWHRFCKDCVRHHVTLLVNERKLTTCPKCGKGWDRSTLIACGTTMDTIALYDRYTIEKSIMFDKTKVLCPNPKCGSVVHGGVKTREARCSQCSHAFCFRCGVPWTKLHICLKSKAENAYTMMWWTGGEELVSCPKCDVMIEKNGGCQHLKCARCSHEFCFYCHGDYYHHTHTKGKLQGALCPLLRIVHSRKKIFGLDPITRTFTKTIAATVIVAAGATGVVISLPIVPIILVAKQIKRHRRARRRMGLA